MGEEIENLGSLTRVGIISDTHGVVHPRVAERFAGVEAILHAGDIGGMHVIRELERIAPVVFIPGNIDGVEDAVRRVTIGGVRVLLTHILPRPRKLAAHVARSLRDEPADLVVFGHSHLPHDELVDGVRFFNPASAGPRRFDYPVSIGLLEHGVPRHVALDERSEAALAKRMNQLR
ncbi:MAG TPA: metallophosphoesterase family protein [Thermoanaerobaculia bacterium]|nr:metallophosphoesterase family protein [Thermoanaerobaculia bacterium]